MKSPRPSPAVFDTAKISKTGGSEDPGMRLLWVYTVI